MNSSKILRLVARNALLGAALLATLAGSALVTMRVVLSSRAVAVREEPPPPAYAISKRRTYPQVLAQ